jgi:maleylacetoacetate isomerase
VKKIPYEYKAINLLKGEQNEVEYRKINSLGGVPSLQHEGKFISESLAIVEYLEEKFPQPRLLPQDPFLRARIRQFCEVINSFMHPMGNLKTLQFLEKHHSYSQEQKEQWVQHWAHQGLQTLELLITEFSGTYSFGADLSMADVFLIPQVLTCQRFKVDLSPYKEVLRINENCLKLSEFQKAHPFRQVDTPEELKIN